ncbi:glycosyltransferase family 4 protein [Chthonomonas calidirosea]|uniref:glycosyltransferase family 4 protein n=1 Tax=Chthonomonas calidirosea TaxID=454171 RepID=UPI001E433B2C|nr:glycosyltransferase family 4 protein [Chthonomonas calidirosea]
MPMRILLVAQNYHPFIGGVETHARQIAHEMSKKHHVDIAAGNFLQKKLPTRLAVLGTSLLVPSYPSYQDGPVFVHSLTPKLFDRVRMLPIALRCVPKLCSLAYHSLNRFGYPWYRNVYLPKLRALVQGVDVVHSLAGGYLGWTAQEAAKRAGVPFVCTPFCHPHQWGDGPEDIAYYQKADAVIGLVETDRDYLVSIGVPKEKTHVIGVSPELPERADPEEFRKRHGLEGVPIVLYVGRMMPQKGAKAVFDAAPLVWERFPEARFVFIGPGTVDWFQAADPRIVCLGKVSFQEKADALAACDIFCMPSLSEILPTVYLEAWSYGKPVVGGMAHGLPELVEGNCAGLNVSQKPPEVAEAIIKLLANPELRTRFGENGRQLVCQKYSVAAVTQALLTLYSSLLESRETVAL